MIYIVLGVLYESYVHPITILSSLPSAGVGALLALLVCGENLSLVALIGIILLIGIVQKNAIMMIDFALDAERTEGLPPVKSIYQACLLRFRPIMMTTMAALLGALPLALQRGTGSELRRPLGIAIVGGLLLSQLITLYTTPVVYLYLDRLARWARRGRPAVDYARNLASRRTAGPGHAMKATWPYVFGHGVRKRRPNARPNEPRTPGPRPQGMVAQAPSGAMSSRTCYCQAPGSLTHRDEAIMPLLMERERLWSPWL